MANFISSLSGSALNDALQQVEARIPEGWAVGTYDGVAVGSNSPYFHNNAKYYAALAQSAVPSGTSGALFWNVDQSATLSASDKSQARANIMAGGSNPNLLDNPWFTVNQRGATSGTTGSKTYGVDRWYTTYGSSPGTYNIAASGITLTPLSGDYMNVVQVHSNDNLWNYLLGKTITASVMLSDGTIYSGTKTLSTVGALLSFYSGNGVNLLKESNRLECRVTATKTIRAVKLELGSYSTLANDAPPNYAEELAKCQYYYRKVGTSASATLLGMGFIESNGTTATFPSALPKMRTNNPTITRTGSLYVRVAGNDTNHSFTDQSVSSSLQHTVISLKNVANVAAGNTVWLVAASGGFLELSADL